MPKLKDDEQTKNKIKGIVSSVYGELGEVESFKALEFYKWMLSKAVYYKKHIFKDKFSHLPEKMERGDIVWVQFGINVGSEFSDFGTDGHFAMIWAQNGFEFIVIPISAEERKPEDNDYAINLGRIEGLPKDKDSYAKLDAIRSVNIRRIKRINGKKTGKISLKTINPELITLVNLKIIDKLICK